jgi:hypothetical protein
MSTSPTGTPSLTHSQREWLRVRSSLQDHRFELGGLAVREYPGTATVEGTPLLTRSAWSPSRPVPMAAIDLAWTSTPSPAVGLPVTGDAVSAVCPDRADGSRYPCYSAAVAELAAPRVFQNRTTYQLRAADLASDKPVLAFGPGTYFDGTDTGEACAHEFAAFRLGLRASMPLREAVGDPCDPARRPTNVAISVLTLRHDRASGEAGFPLHWRDPAKVGHAGGLYMVVPVGVFQAAADGPAHQRNDFSLWRCLLREFAEELLGEPEDLDDDAPIDYDARPLAASMTAARQEGLISAHVLGMGVDPLTFATDLLSVVCLDSEVYDDLFGRVVAENSEGRIQPAGADQPRFPFTAGSVDRLTRDEPLQAAGAALLRLAWRHRDAVLLS